MKRINALAYSLHESFGTWLAFDERASVGGKYYAIYFSKSLERPRTATICAVGMGSRFSEKLKTKVYMDCNSTIWMPLQDGGVHQTINGAGLILDPTCFQKMGLTEEIKKGLPKIQTNREILGSSGPIDGNVGVKGFGKFSFVGALTIYVPLKSN